jgi:cytochrome c oxidase subunit 1
VNIALSVAVFVYNMIRSWRRGERAVANPWNAQTLEWQIPSPPPIENFGDIPTVTDTPYQYGTPPMPASAGAPVPIPGTVGLEPKP